MKQHGSGQGLNRWRDTAVYVDGKPVGVVTFGELPIGLKPVWVPEEHSIEFDYGYKGPRTTDHLRAALSHDRLSEGARRRRRPHQADPHHGAEVDRR